MNKQANAISFRTTAIYFGIAALYILLSDQLLLSFIKDPVILGRIEIYKGLAFVLITSVVLYFDIRSRMEKVLLEKEAAETARKAMALSELNYRNMSEYSSYTKLVIVDGKIKYGNNAALLLLKANKKENILDRDIDSLFLPESLETLRKKISELQMIGQSFTRFEGKIVNLNGDEIDIECSGSLFPYNNDEKAVHLVLRNISDLLSTRREIHRTVTQLNGLNEIDHQILNNYEIEPIIEATFDHLLSDLGVDAASIIVNNVDGVTSYSTRTKGFKSNLYFDYPYETDIERIDRIIFTKKPISAQALPKSETAYFDPAFIKNESIESYLGLPLISKGKVKGVLEIFFRSNDHPKSIGYEGLETIAKHLAIAIDNIQSNELNRRSLFEITKAYSRTIEGWSRVIDMRDHQKSGHTKRVMQYAMILAQKLGVSSSEMINIRYGSLLHDIGILGIPDEILLKEGKLTPKEMEIMRLHPKLAFDILHPIPYLHNAIDIPYCHHEKWDGTGYPRGLKRDQIPLAARIFSVIDVWDSMRTDRVYRKKLPEESILQYIREQSGKHFDPKIVDLFFESYDQLEHSGDEKDPDIEDDTSPLD